MIEDLLIGIVLGIVIHYVWQHIVIWRTMREIEKSSGRSIDQIMQELSGQSVSAAAEIKNLDCELVQGQLLIYDQDTQQFVAQGASLESVTDSIHEKLGEGPYRIRFKFDGEALERIKQELKKA